MPGQTVPVEPLTRSERAFVAALAGLLKEMDFQDIRVTEILARAGYSRGAFYARFADKYDLANRMIERELLVHVQHTLDYVRAMEEGGDEAHLLAVQIDHYQHIYDHRDLYEVILDSRLPGLTLDEFCGRLHRLLQERIPASPSAEASGYDADFYGYVTLYASIICIKYWRLHNYRFSPEYVARQTLAFIKPGLPPLTLPSPRAGRRG